MKKDWIRTLLSDAIARRSPVALMRKKIGAMPLLCIPLQMSEKLVLVAPYADFKPDGFEVVRLRDISNVRADEQAAFHEQVMQGEGVLSQLCPPRVSLENFPALLADLFALGEPVAVSGKEDVLLLGTLEKAGKKKIRVRYVDGGGHVDEDPTRFAYEDISSVSFGNRYLKLVIQYADKMPATEDEKSGNRAAQEE